MDTSKRYEYAENELSRDFKASEPYTKWVADITYIRTISGWLYLTTVLFIAHEFASTASMDNGPVLSTNCWLVNE